MTFDYLLAKRQTNASAGHFEPVQALEQTEDALRVFGLDADAVVCNGKDGVAILEFTRDVDAGQAFFAAVLDGVFDQVFENHAQLRVVREHDGKLAIFDVGPILLDELGEAQESCMQGIDAFHGLDTEFAAAQLCVRNGRLEKVAHAIGAADYEFNDPLRLFVQGALELARKQLDLSDHNAQGLLQVMSAGKCELAKLSVMPLERLGKALLVIDISAGAEPFDNFAFGITQRLSAA